jgi:hypothetical protein
MRPIALPLLCAALAVLIFTACPSAQSASLSDAEVASLLGELRADADWSRGFESLGSGRVLSREGTARILAGDNGRYRLQVDEPVYFAEMHDGTTTWKLYPWGSVLDIEGREEEMSLVPMWVLTGYWLSPDAPLVISAGGAGREGDVVALRVQHRDGHLPFEVLVDTKERAPIQVRAADVPPNFIFEIGNHHFVDNRAVPGSLRVLNRGMAVAELEFEPPRDLTPDEANWSRPPPIAQATFDSSVSTRVEARDDGRGYLFVRPVINGTQFGWFLFDTGAPATILGLGVVKELELDKLAEGQTGGVGGAAQVDVHALESVQLGPVRVGPVHAISRDLMRLGWKNLPIEGILGCDVLMHAVVEYDVRSGVIEFHDPTTYELPSGVTWQRIRLNEGKPVIQVPFEEHEGEFLVDTAAGGTFFISKPMVDRLDLLKGRKTQNLTVTGVGGSVVMQSGRLDWLEFGGTRYENVRTNFAVSDQGSYSDPYPDGIVGINLIDDYRVVFDLGNKRMAFLGR